MKISDEKPFGSWKSPITSELIVSDAVKLSQVQLDRDEIYWIEARSSEGGRNVLVKRSANGSITDVTTDQFNVRTRCHEYGGGGYAICDGQIAFSNYSDQRLYLQKKSEAPVVLSIEGKYRYADSVFDRTRNRIITVTENHEAGHREASNYISAVGLDGPSTPQKIISGNDFYSNPTISPDGRQLAWLTWNHPNMPWDGTELWVGELDENGKLSETKKIAGGKDESIFQPQWSNSNRLYFVSDRSGWWNIYSLQNNQTAPVFEMEAEFGLPQWNFGMSTYALISETQILCTYFKDSLWHMGILEVDSRKIQPIELPFTFFESVRANSEHAAFIAGSAVSTNAVVRLDIKTMEFSILKHSAKPNIDFTYFSRPEVIEFPASQGRKCHAYFYPPQNRDSAAPSGHLPPLIVKSHGGPTGSANPTLDLRVQFWTSRGFALVDVNYSGSTGYGRNYRQRLDGQWGVIDVEDCIFAARYLAAKQRIDENRVAIAGGSAGGFTTLCALTFHDYFKVGASYYGISDLESMALDTHKFESKYLERLIGPFPEKRDLYLERSPIHFTDKLSCPIIIMQGEEDPIVTPIQAEKMAKALQKNGLPVAYLSFAGEQHGFRKAETIKRSLESELYFYSKIFKFVPADDIEPVVIDDF